MSSNDGKIVWNTQLDHRIAVSSLSLSPLLFFVISLLNASQLILLTLLHRKETTKGNSFDFTGISWLCNYSTAIHKLFFVNQVNNLGIGFDLCKIIWLYRLSRLLSLFEQRNSETFYHYVEVMQSFFFFCHNDPLFGSILSETQILRILFYLLSERIERVITVFDKMHTVISNDRIKWIDLNDSIGHGCDKWWIESYLTMTHINWK